LQTSNLKNEPQDSFEHSDPPKKTWAEKYSENKHHDKWLALFSFIEASFFPLPPSTLMVAIMSSNGNHKKWFYYASVTTIFSVLGGLFGYLIGFVFYDTLGQFIISTYDLSENMTKVSLMFKDNAFLAIFIAAFTPIPYKVFTLASGFFGINLIVFIVASILGRGMRFYAVSFLMSILGERISKKALTYLNQGAIIVAFLVIIYFIYKILGFTTF